MQTQLYKCDKCGFSHQENDNISWENHIRKIIINCPPDGVNHGKYNVDLCYKCRNELNNLISNFLNQSGMEYSKENKNK